MHLASATFERGLVLQQLCVSTSFVSKIDLLTLHEGCRFLEERLHEHLIVTSFYAPYEPLNIVEHGGVLGANNSVAPASQRQSVSDETTLEARFTTEGPI